MAKKKTKIPFVLNCNAEVNALKPGAKLFAKHGD